MHLSSYDLNALVSLQALLEECNVTRAGDRVGLSQSAMSNALARLRRQYGDELLVRHGRDMTLTPLGRELLAALRPAMTMIERVVTVHAGFDPASTTRAFRVQGSDYGLALVAGRLAGPAREAPGLRVDLEMFGSGFVEQVDELVRTADLVVAPRAYLGDYPGVEFDRDSWVVVVDAANTDIGDELSEEALRKTRLVRAYPDARVGTTLEMQLRARGVPLHGTVTIQSFLTLPFAVAGTDHVGFLPRRLAARLAPACGLRLVEPTFPLADLVEWIVWHPSRDEDEGHRWFRGRLTQSSG